jgi:hypothetical protein
MRSPGFRRIIHTRVFSVSDRQLGSDAAVRLLRLARELGFQRGVHSTLTWLFADFSFMDIANGIAPAEYALSYNKFR